MLNKNDLHIAISGKSGCGNSTVSRMLAERLNLHLVNYTFRSIAREKGLTFEEVCRLAEESDDYDRQVDETQVKLARQGGSVLGSRLAIWMFKKADLKVVLNGSPRIRAERIVKREGGNIERQLAATMERDKRDHDRYLRIYGIDNNDVLCADLILNTDRFNARQVVDIIETAVKNL